MLLRIGYEILYDCPQPTPTILTLNVHHSRVSDLLAPDHIRVAPAVPLSGYRDGFGNWCTRLIAPAGRTRLYCDALIRDDGQPDRVVREACLHPVPELPEDTLGFLLPSRYCDSDRLSQLAWDTFGQTGNGWERVQAVCDFVHRHLRFDYLQARDSRTASEAYQEKVGVCRDFTHMAIALCRALNIPARYCTGYLGDVGTPPPYPPGDFAAWFEAYIGGAWQMFDPRNNEPRIGRVLIARGRDAADAAIATTFGPHTLSGFTVWADEVPDSVGEGYPA